MEKQICSKCKRVLEPYEHLAFFKKKSVCSICYLKLKFPGKITKVLLNKIADIKHRNQLKKKALEKRKRLDWEKTHNQKFLVRNKKPIPSRICENPKCKKEFPPNSVLQHFCSLNCRKRNQFNKEKIKSKTF